MAFRPLLRFCYALALFCAALAAFAAPRKGYVYVISNYGSFGRAVYKIGATTRKDPYVRVLELSGTAVPYPFRVHYMIPTDDTFGLEHRLHRALAAYRIRKNREFFRLPLAKINDALRAENIRLADVRPDPSQREERMRPAQRARKGAGAKRRAGAPAPTHPFSTKR